MAEWTETERAAWAPPPDLTVSEWADKYRILAPGTSSEPGPWRTDRTPYLRGIQDAMGDPRYERVTFMKSPQVGGSEAARNCLGRWIDIDPAPCMIVYPSDQAAREMIDERVVPMIRATPQLRKYLTGVKRDVKLNAVKLLTMPIYTGTAGSPQSLASRPIRYVICDETDKYPRFSGREADPVGLAEARTRTYGHRRKLIEISTPTTVDGVIARSWNAAPVRKHFHLPCPYCHHYQKLKWHLMEWDGGNPDHVGDRTRLAAEVDAGKVKVRYRCEGCDELIDESHKHWMLSQGQWEDEEGSATSSRWVAFHISTLYSPWVRWSRIVAEYLTSRESLEDMMRFVNQWLGEPFEEKIAEVSSTIFEDLQVPGLTFGMVPEWTHYIVSVADTQKNSWWYLTRAYGKHGKSHLVDYGRAYSLKELREKTLDRVFLGPHGGLIRPAVLGVDAGGGTKTEDGGNTTDIVYKFHRSDPNRIWALRGYGGSTSPASSITTKTIRYAPGGYDVILRLLDTQYYKDVLADRMKRGGWTLCAGVDDEYKKQMQSEHKVLIRKGQQATMMWVAITKSAANHLWDCEVYQVAMCDILRLTELDGEPVNPVQAREDEDYIVNPGIQGPNGPFISERY